MKVIVHAKILGECPSPSIKVHGRADDVRKYELKVQQATPKWVRQTDDKIYRLRIDFYLSPPRLQLSDLDNMAKTIMDGIFGKFGQKNTKPRDRHVWQLELNKFRSNGKAHTEFWLFELGNVG